MDPTIATNDMSDAAKRIQELERKCASHTENVIPVVEAPISAKMKDPMAFEREEHDFIGYLNFIKHFSAIQQHYQHF